MTVLPVLRRDIRFLPAPADDGAPAWLVHDPLTGTFDKADWVQMEVLRRLRQPVTLDALLQSLSRVLTVPVDEDYVLECCNDAVRRGLTTATRVRDVNALLARRNAKRRHPLVWLFHHYLYVRIPLLAPDRFLTRTWPAVKRLVSWPALAAIALLSCLGVLLLLQHSERYAASLPAVITPWTVLAYAAALVGVKLLHEFGHAYAAKGQGCRVPAMGVAFLVMMPVPYCDVTDTWRLRNRSRRLLVSGAGILVELALAGVALFLWALSPPGVWRQVFHVVSSATLVSTLLVNLNPAMRYDGYYLLSDLLGIDNLQPRAFAVTRWWLRRALLGMDLDPPENGLSRRRVAMMTGYSLYAWVYRFFLYLGIAVLVYHKFWKGLGIILFAAEIAFFLIRPAVNETAALIRQRGRLSINPRSVLTILAALALLAWIVLPLPRRASIPGVLMPAREQAVYAPFSGEVVAAPVKLGDSVQSGDLLARLKSRELLAEKELAELSLQRLHLQRRLAESDPERKDELPRKGEEIARFEAILRGFEKQLAQAEIRAQLNGTVTHWAESLPVGSYVHAGQELGRIANPDRWRVVAYLPEDQAGNLSVDQTTVFCPQIGTNVTPGTVRRISRMPVQQPVHKALLTGHGGPLSERLAAPGRPELAGSFYEVVIEIDGAPARWAGETGRIHFRTPPRSLLLGWLRYGWHVLVRESGV